MAGLATAGRSIAAVRREEADLRKVMLMELGLVLTNERCQGTERVL